MGIQTVLKTALSYFSDATAGIENLYVEQHDLEGDISELSLRVVGASAVALFVLMGLAVLTKDRIKQLKLPLFIMMSVIMAGSTILLAASTVYLNVKSDSGGPVHWHADIEFWICDNEVELIDPTGFSNKVGTWTLHEHDDHRIHLEGVVVDGENDASLGKFMHVVDGAITDEALVLPVNPDGPIFENDVDGDGPSDPFPSYAEEHVIVANGKRYVKVVNGNTCAGEAAELQVFVYSFNKEDDTYSQRKLDDVAKYTMTDESIVPPGDCVIVEFAPFKEKTNRLCEQYGVQDIDRCVEFGVDPDKTAVCKIRQVDYNSGGAE